MKTTAKVGSSVWSFICTVASALVCTLACTWGGAAHAQPQSPPSTSSPADTEAIAIPSSELMTGQVFQTFGSGSEFVNRIRERLQDPQQRALMRAEHRAMIAASHPDVAQVLEIDATTREKLFDLLADQIMEQQEESLLHRAEQDLRSDDPMASLQANADRENERLEPIRNLLGERKLARYQSFTATAGERMLVAQFDARLGAAHKLSADQRERLVTVIREQHERFVDQSRSDHSNRPMLSAPPGEAVPMAELQRQSQLQGIAHNEEHWRRMPETDRLLRERAAAFLTPAQLSTLAQIHAGKAQALRQWIEQSRIQAGLSPNIPDRPAATHASPAPVTREVKVTVKLTVNRNQPILFTDVVSSGKSVTFVAPEGLLVEATPTVFDDQMFNLRVSYYEQDSAGKRLIGHGGSMGSLNRASADPSSMERLGFGGTVIVGTKAYAIGMSALVEGM